MRCCGVDFVSDLEVSIAVVVGLEKGTVRFGTVPESGHLVVPGHKFFYVLSTNSSIF